VDTYTLSVQDFSRVGVSGKNLDVRQIYNIAGNCIMFGRMR